MYSQVVDLLFSNDLVNQEIAYQIIKSNFMSIKELTKTIFEKGWKIHLINYSKQDFSLKEYFLNGQLCTISFYKVLEYNFPFLPISKNDTITLKECMTFSPLFKDYNITCRFESSSYGQGAKIQPMRTLYNYYEQQCLLKDFNLEKYVNFINNFLKECSRSKILNFPKIEGFLRNKIKSLK